LRSGEQRGNEECGGAAGACEKRRDNCNADPGQGRRDARGEQDDRSLDMRLRSPLDALVPKHKTREPREPSREQAEDRQPNRQT